jgi:hypothetical protein
MLDVFTTAERSGLRSHLLERAAKDQRISGAAITGSAAAEREDAWSDIDLAFGIVDGTDLSSVLSDWTTYMQDTQAALHHVDVKFGAWVYRVFLLSNTLQVDLAFAPASEFRPLATTFRLVFGIANAAADSPPQRQAEIIGLDWLYALHARSAIARERWWQAEYMVSGVRNNAFALACVRCGLPVVHGKGFDQLPAGLKLEFAGALVRKLERGELLLAFRAAVELLVREIADFDKELGLRLKQTLVHLIDSIA